MSPLCYNMNHFFANPVCLCIPSMKESAVSTFFTFSTVITQRPSPSRTLHLNGLVGM